MSMPKAPHVDLPDRLGSVRRSPTGTVLAVLWPSPPAPDRWMLTDRWGSLGYEPNATVADWPIVGAVPYSPAAGMALDGATPEPAPGVDPIAELREGLLEIAVVGPVRARTAAPEVAAPWAVAAQSAYAAAVLLNHLALSDPKAAGLLATALNGPAVEHFAHKCAVDGARFYGLPVDQWIADARAAAEDGAR
ncbi:hypothetical protein ACWD33_26350 [Streptomyces xiamenensis]